MQIVYEGRQIPVRSPRAFSCGCGGNRVSFAIAGDFMRIDIAGEALDPGIVACFREALSEGAMHPNMMTLVDLLNFKGRFDWATIHAIADLAPWGTAPGRRRPRVAFVTGSIWFSAILKVTAILFPTSEHRQFSSVRNAECWLTSAEG